MAIHNGTKYEAIKGLEGTSRRDFVFIQICFILADRHLARPPQALMRAGKK
ncbi:hypothetical protein DFO67_11019 [Modicisalibacter xianhensis]|uniref:Uncharacterized protein n=1 Tax=Modicisalibacter xianhensis TaxID=442341 RepID=A0A4V3GTU5_9GAMM|nr:hypothetical protein [Halomonas xianhensis]TDX28319.1 hypothetical protein DFO67_11019 [Halomonas xianhensis]